MIGSPITHSSLESQHCRGTCMTPGLPTRRLLKSREKDTPGHPRVVRQPMEKAVVPMGAILTVVKIQDIQVLIFVLTDHVAHRQGLLFHYIQEINSSLLVFILYFRRWTTAEDITLENLPWTMQLRASLMEQQ